MKRRILSLLLCLCLVLALLPVSALAAESGTYLVLGDSISTGYGLTEDACSFVDLIAAERGYTVVNHAVNGNTAAGILSQLQGGDLNSDIAAADFITITVGGNDILDSLYERIAALYNADYKVHITPDDIIARLSSPPLDLDDFILLSYVAIALNGTEDGSIVPFAESEGFADALAAFDSELAAVATYIRTLNPAVPIVVTTQYHPYSTFTEGLFSALNTNIDNGAQKLRQTILYGAADAGYLAADVYTAFCESDVELCNASPDPLNLDFHPNAAGHAVIAACILAVPLPEPEPEPEPEDKDEKPSGPSKPSIRPSRENEDTPAEEVPCTGGRDCPGLSYGDVDPAAWYHEAVDYMLEHGLMNGTGEDTFSPDTAVSRAMLVAILHRLEGSPDLPADYNVPAFSDVTAETGAWYIDAVRWAAYEGIVTGYADGTFVPNAAVTREQMVAMLYRYAQYKGADISAAENANILSYTDALDISEYAVSAMQWACGAGLISGVSAGVLAPSSATSRAQTAKVIMLLCESALK